jgi:hypothetical protein
MSGSRFWTDRPSRRRDNGEEEAMIGAELTVVDRCDRCGARAYVRVLLPNSLELLFCAHHSRQHASALTKIAIEIHDETERLVRTAA